IAPQFFQIGDPAGTDFGKSLIILVLTEAASALALFLFTVIGYNVILVATNSIISTAINFFFFLNWRARL
ncbi:MAG: hypothetical protein ACFFBD_22500, partial [Candidatus Hodarchaeota archaeon]